MTKPTHHPTPNKAYNNLITTLLSHPHKFLSLPTSPLRLLTQPDKIATLTLHPTLESTMHLLNRDLPSAHFLLRHAQAAPAYESMYLHGMLHRIEGDVDNARAWYGDVEGSEVFEFVWSREDGGKDWKGFLDRVERWRDRVARRDGAKTREAGRSAGAGKDGEVIDWQKEEEVLDTISLWEIMKVLDFCERKFGVNEYQDVSGEYTMMGEKNADVAAQMITGGEGWREF